MAQSKRKRRVKARRQAAQAQRQRSRQRRQTAEEAAREAGRRAAQLFDPATPVDIVAQFLSDALDGRPTRVGYARLLQHARGTHDVLAIAKRLCEISVDDDGSPSLTALAFSAEAHYLAGDWDAARSNLDAALDRASDDGDRQEMVCHLRSQGRPSECVEQLGTWLAEFPADPDMAATFGYAIEDIHRRLTSAPPEGACPCGSGSAWSGCCQDRDAATLAWFGRRDSVRSLHSAMRDFVAGSRYEHPVAEHVAEWQSASDADLWDDGARRAIDLLAFEHAWAAVSASDENDEDNPLNALCASEFGDPDISDYARAWFGKVRYGLWQVDGDPSAGPPTGVHVTELCTGQSLYVALPQPLKAKLARWSVLLGAVVPLDGAWRFTTAAIAASPTEADALIEVVQAATETLIHDLSDEPMQHEPTIPTPIGRAEPHSVYAYEDHPAQEPLAGLICRVVGSLLPRLLGDIHEARATPPTLTNTDGEPMEMISARVAVNDTAALLERLSRHADFDVHDVSTITWLGREVPTAQLETMRAEVEAKFGSQPSEEDEPQRWVRGTLTQADGQLRIEVNSRGRLESLLRILSDCDADPVVVDESHLDPRQDLAWPAQHRPALGGMASAADGWEKHWLDESVPALGGMTPRDVVDSEFRPHLERMLRQFEYDADICRLAGEKGVDTDWLRDALDMIEY